MMAASDRPPAEIFQEYLRARTATMRRGATDVDINRLVSFYTDDIVYEDAKVKVHVEGKETLRSGIISHSSEYAGSALETRISVDSSISLANAVAAVITEVFWINGSAGRQEIQRKRLQVAEFRGDKICHFIDYH
ncbi:MAG: hypothetical protein LAP87_29970 [Acidobacteriia bacterium]|nr:hypothetical protein [Terriglobia bacterium]